jgi:putative hydrolase of the HAD superfamily
MPHTLSTIAFDADDTLWHNERFFQLTQQRFAELLKDFTEPGNLMARLIEAERRNIQHYGFGVKGFVLSMIETAIEVTEEKVPARVISELLAAGQEMLNHPIDLLPYAEGAVRKAAETHHILLITKGDLLDQERKLAQSGLGDYFDRIEIVSDKNPHTYSRIFGNCMGGADHALMIGNSLKSDIIPALEAGAWAAFTRHEVEWELEKADPPLGAARYKEICDLSELPDLITSIEMGDSLPSGL